jgi:hypothetical protein
MRIQSKYLDEKLTAADPTSKWISDFVHSNNPKFAGKSKKERIRMALGASYAAKGQSRNEEITQVDELKKSTLASYVNKAAGGVDNSVASKFLDMGSQHARGEHDKAGKSAQLGAKRIQGIRKAVTKLAKEEIDSVPASKSLQKAHDDERKKRGLPDPSYYLELMKKKKQEIEDMKKEEVTPPFTPDKPKKNPGVVPGKYGVGPSLAKHLAKKGMQKQLEKNPVKEEVEELDEISKGLAIRYAKKANVDLDKRDASGEGITRKSTNRETGLGRAVSTINKQGGLTMIDRLRHGIKKGSMVGVKEKVEPIEELSKTTLASYAKKAAKKSKINQMMADRFEKDSERSRNPYKKIAVRDLAKDYQNKAWKREDGYNKAIDRLAKEEVELDEEESAHTKLMNHHAKLAKESAKKAHEFANKNNRKKYEHFHDLADKHVDASYAHEKAAKTNNPQHSKDAYAATKEVNKMGMREELEINEMDKSQPSSSRGAEGLPVGKKAEPAKTDKVMQDALKALQKQYKKVKEEVDLDESGGPVVWKKGNDHIEKYGNEKFALYKNGKKTKYYKSMDDAKSALQEDGKLKGGAKDPCWKGYQMVGTKKKGGREVPNCVPREETELKSFKALREKLNGNR